MYLIVLTSVKCKQCQIIFLCWGFCQMNKKILYRFISAKIVRVISLLKLCTLLTNDWADMYNEKQFCGTSPIRRMWIFMDYILVVINGKWFWWIVCQTNQELILPLVIISRQVLSFLIVSSILTSFAVVDFLDK